METHSRGSWAQKGRYLLGSISVLLVLLAVRVGTADSRYLSNNDPDTVRTYKNLFEYRMCDALDPNWCPNGDDFKATLFDAMFADPTLGSQPEYFWWDDRADPPGWRPHYKPEPGGSLTAYAVDLCERGEASASNRCPEVYDFDVVSCTDGTRPLFYHEPGQGADANRWIFKIQGGGLSCANCSESILGGDRSHLSSAYNENKSTTNASGIFSNNADNTFKDHTVVMLDKCVGDRNLGDTTATDLTYSGSANLPDGTGPVYFHGYRIILAVLGQLKRDFNLSDAEEILFITQSNGSNGAYHYIDRLSSHVRQTLGIDVPVRLLAQGYILPGPEVEFFFENGYWPASYSDIPSSMASPGIISAPNTDPLEACGPGFDPADPYYSHWILEGRRTTGARTCDRSDPWEAQGGVDGREYATEDFASGFEQGSFMRWGVDNGITETWDESCVQAHLADADLRACRDSRHVFTHHLSTPVFFAAQAADRNLRTIARSLSMWSPLGNVWSPADMQTRVEKLAEVVSGVQSRSSCADADIANHGFFIDNTVDHMAVTDMSKLTRKMKANAGDGNGVNFQLQHYLKYWMHPVMSPTVQCLDSNDLYDAEFAPGFEVKEWPALVRCESGYYAGGTQPYQICDDPGFANPTDLALNKADARFTCEAPSPPTRLHPIFLPLVNR